MGGGAYHHPFDINAHINFHRRFTMYIRTTLAAAMTAVVLLTASGCAVTRGQETVGAYVDDASITTAVKARFIETVPSCCLAFPRTALKSQLPKALPVQSMA
jgi:hypothetical protein